MFMWPALAQVIDDNNEEEASTRLLFAHLLESIIGFEFPSIKFALKVIYTFFNVTIISEIKIDFQSKDFIKISEHLWNRLVDDM